MIATYRMQNLTSSILTSPIHTHIFLSEQLAPPKNQEGKFLVVLPRAFLRFKVRIYFWVGCFPRSTRLVWNAELADQADCRWFERETLYKLTVISTRMQEIWIDVKTKLLSSQS